jgi:aminoglycoside phosphotransferase (APT) family kinase protein
MAASASPGRLIGSGRAADVYELDAGRVLRRYRVAVDVEPEARLMTYLRSAGYPVPEVFDAQGPDMVMARLSGTDLLSDLARRPWMARAHALMLADMHDRLHQIEAPPGLPAVFEPAGAGEAGRRVLHLDLHPGNVMLTPDGPVVIDWSNGAAGPAGADVAMAALIMEVSEVDDLPRLVRLVAGQIRRTFVRHFMRGVSADPGPYLSQAALRRIEDRNVRPAEIEQLRRRIGEHAGG